MRELRGDVSIDRLIIGGCPPRVYPACRVDRPMAPSPQIIDAAASADHNQLVHNSLQRHPLATLWVHQLQRFREFRQPVNNPGWVVCSEESLRPTRSKHPM